MGLFDRFFNKEKSEESWVKRKVRGLVNKYGQKELREDAMYALFQRGTPESIGGLLQRFTIDLPDSIVDEREKNKIIDLLESLGAEKVSAPLRSYLADPKQSALSMALIAMDTLEGEETTIQEISTLLDASDPNDAWSSERKLQLIGHLDTIETKQIPEKLLQMLIKFLQDLDDDVIFRCIALLERFGNDDQIRNSMVELLLQEETSMRIRARILETALERKWYLGDMRTELEKKLPEGYFFDKRNHLKYREPAMS